MKEKLENKRAVIEVYASTKDEFINYVFEDKYQKQKLTQMTINEAVDFVIQHATCDGEKDLYKEDIQKNMNSSDGYYFAIKSKIFKKINTEIGEEDQRNHKLLKEENWDLMTDVSGNEFYITKIQVLENKGQNGSVGLENLIK